MRVDPQSLLPPALLFVVLSVTDHCCPLLLLFLSYAQEEQELRKNVQSGYREKVDKFNRHLESLTEHNDIPKVGNAGCG